MNDLRKEMMRQLVAKLENNEELTTEEYDAIASYENGKILGRGIMYTNDPKVYEMFLEYSVLGTIGEKMKDEAEYLSKSCQYMLAAITMNCANYTTGMIDYDIVINNLNRLNTLNYVREVKEIINYESLVKNLHEKISSYTALGFNVFNEDVVKDDIEALEESREKIKIYRNKYLKK